MAADEFLNRISRALETDRQHRVHRADRAHHQVGTDACRSIDGFRADPRYDGDGKRADLAYAVYALSRGLTEVEVEAAIRSRDLSHKGNERRQHDYVERTIKKAAAAAERGRAR